MIPSAEKPRPKRAGARKALKRIGRRVTHLPPLSPAARIILLVAGFLLILLGLAGLALPVLQGVLLLALGGAVLSLVSARFLEWLRHIFRPCPRAWRRLLLFRRRVHGWFSRSGPEDDTER